MRGRVRMFRDKELLFDVNNLVVIGATVASANLAAGASLNNSISVMGYGSGTQTPSFYDTGLIGTAQYFNQITSHSFPSQGSVLFNFQITVTDYAAQPSINIQEIGLFGTTNAVGIPASVGIVSATWLAGNTYLSGAIIKDSNNNIQRCTTQGTSGAGQHPTWNTVVNGTTTDNTAVWTMVAGGLATSPMWAHALVPSFTFTGVANYTGSWTITF